MTVRYFKNIFSETICKFPEDIDLITFYIVKLNDNQYYLNAVPTVYFQVMKKCTITGSTSHIPVSQKQAQTILDSDYCFKSNNPSHQSLLNDSTYSLENIKHALAIPDDQNLPDEIFFNDMGKCHLYAQEQRLESGAYSHQIINPKIGETFSVKPYAPRTKYYQLVNDCVDQLQRLLEYTVTYAYQTTIYVDIENANHRADTKESRDTTLIRYLSRIKTLINSPELLQLHSYNSHLMLPALEDEKIFKQLIELKCLIEKQIEYTYEVTPEYNSDIIRTKLNRMAIVFETLGSLQGLEEKAEPFKGLYGSAMTSLENSLPAFRQHRDPDPVMNFLIKFIPYLTAVIKNLTLLIPPYTLYRAYNSCKNKIPFFFPVTRPDLVKTKSERFVESQLKTRQSVLDFCPNPSFEGSGFTPS